MEALLSFTEDTSIDRYIHLVTYGVTLIGLQ
jgi:hypothetical protein